MQKNYICTGCGAQVLKEPCRREDDKNDYVGLGKWKCKQCGGKAVRAVAQKQK